MPRVCRSAAISAPKRLCARLALLPKSSAEQAANLGFVNLPPFCLKAASKIWPVSCFGFGQCGYGPLGSPLAVDERSHQLVPQKYWHWKRRARPWQPIIRLIHQASVNNSVELAGVAQQSFPSCSPLSATEELNRLCASYRQEGSHLPVPDLTE